MIAPSMDLFWPPGRARGNLETSMPSGASGRIRTRDPLLEGRFTQRVDLLLP
jgi:hypothetical protein